MAFEAVRDFFTHNERDRRQQLLGIFIEDHIHYQKEWSKLFDVPGVACSQVITPLDPEKLTEQLQLIDPSVINIVVVDQFYEPQDMPLRRRTSDFISQIREINPQVWIIEQSFTPQNAVFEESDVVLRKQEIEEMLTLVNKVKHNPQGRFEAIKRWSNAASLRAQRLDINNEDFDFDPQKEWEELLKDKDFNELKDLAKIPNDFIRYYVGMDKNKQRLFLHLGWAILGHISSRSEEEQYSFPLQRLRDITTAKEYSGKSKRAKTKLDGSQPVHYAEIMAPIIWNDFLTMPGDCEHFEYSFINTGVLSYLIGYSEEMLQELRLRMLSRHLAECPLEGLERMNSPFHHLIEKYPQLVDNDGE